MRAANNQRQLTIKGGLIFLFLCLIEDTDDALSLSLATIFDRTLFTFYSLQHHVHIHHKKDCDEQEAVVVVKASLPGLPIKRETCYYTNVSQRLR